MNTLNGESKVQLADEEIASTTFDIYLFLVKVREPVAPREIMRALDISSPGVVNRHLQKLMDWDWVSKDVYGRFVAKKKVNFRGHFWLGRILIPKNILSFAAFLLIVSSVVTLIVLHLLRGGALDALYIGLIIFMVVLAPVLLAEALRPTKRQLEERTKA